jgi:serine/threonine protein kinase
MEYVHGRDLCSVLVAAHAREVRLPLDFVLTVARAVGIALHHAHELQAPDGRHLGIVHRDVSPSNVLASFAGSVKLCDFGVARAACHRDVTRVGYLKGKAGYMAPEYIRHQALDRRSDVFSLGVLLYELATQRRAFETQLGYDAIARTRLLPPSRQVPGLPAELDAVVKTALALDPAARFQSAGVMVRAIEHVAYRHGLVLGETCVASVLGDLFGEHREPWLAPLPVLGAAPGIRLARGTSNPFEDAPLTEVEPIDYDVEIETLVYMPELDDVEEVEIVLE